MWQHMLRITVLSEIYTDVPLSGKAVNIAYLQVRNEIKNAEKGARTSIFSKKYLRIYSN